MFKIQLQFNNIRNINDLVVYDLSAKYPMRKWLNPLGLKYV